MPISSPDTNYLTIVSGLPRSGTSMLMRMLAAGGVAICSDEQRTADTDNPHGYFEHESVKKLSKASDWLVGSEGTALKVIAHLLQYIPSEIPLRVLFIDRDLDEVLASQQKMLDRLGNQGASIPSNQLKAIFSKQLASTKAYLSDRPGTEMLLLNHRDVISDPDGAAEKINSFLGGQLEETKMAAAVDPKLYRNRS